MSEKRISFEEITDRADVKSFSKNLNSLNFNHLDFEVPIQRKGDLWKKSYKVDLIGSILKGLPCGSIHLVKKDNKSSSRWVLDAKQRLLAIKEFIENKFSIKIEREQKTYDLFYRDFSQPYWEVLQTIFQDYQLQIVEHSPMSDGKMLKLFKCINNQVPPSALEKIYSEYFLTKLFLEYCYKHYFPHKEFLESRISDDKRHIGINLLHCVLYTCNGLSLKDSFAIRSLTSKKIKDSAREVNKMLKKKVDAYAKYDAEVIRNLKVEGSLKEIALVCEWFYNALLYKNSLIKDKQLDKNMVLDVFCFFVKKLREGTLTNLYVTQNYGKIYDFLYLYWAWREENKDMKCRSTQESNIEARMKVMQEMLSKVEGIDLSRKNRPITKKQRTEAAFLAERECPISDIELRDSNKESDHSQGAQNTGEMKIVAVNKSANKFTGVSEETHRKIADYQKKFRF